MNKSIIYLKSKFFGFKMHNTESMRDNLDEYNRLTLDLENIGINIDDENKTIILLNSLPKSFTNLVETLKYARDTVSSKDVSRALKSKDRDMMAEIVQRGRNVLIK